MNLLSKVSAGWAKFDWPNQIWLASDLSADWISTKFWSCLARMQLFSRGCHTVGKGLAVKGRVHFFTRRADSVQIGDHVMIISRYRSNPVGITSPCVLDTLPGGEIQIGNHVGLSGVIFSSRSSIIIGNYTKCGGNVRIYDHDYHSLNSETRRNANLDKLDVRTRPVRIGSDVFIGTNAVILKGVTIGDRAIIAAGAIVTRDVPAGEVWGGNPAQRLK